MSKNLSELLGRKGIENSLFDKIGKLSAKEGTPSRKDLEQLSKEFLVGTANTYGTATFYDFLKPENKGKKVYVCNGSACLCAGSQTGVQQKLEATFKPSEIGHMTCLGRCHENAAFHINGHNYSGEDINNLDKIVSKNSTTSEKYKVSNNGQAILTEDLTGLDEFYQPFREALRRESQDILEGIKKSGLRGRGGAGFPAGIKFEFCRNQKSETKFIICNADEGDPGAYSDRYLLEQQPHKVLQGMMIAGLVTGAKVGIVYIRAEYPESVTKIQESIQELMDLKLIGENIQGSEFSFSFKVIQAQGSYICGEETALINSIEGQRPEVRVRPPYPAQQGLFNKPTVVNNVETLAALPYILKNGADSWSSFGTEKSSGTKLISLDSYFNNPGIYEVTMGTPLKEVVYGLGGGFKTDVKAMQIGGPLGGIVPVSKIEDLTLDFESFSKNGFLLGHASFVSIPTNFPMVKYLEHLLEFASEESCGKCFPCRLGTRRGYELFNKAISTGLKIDRSLMKDLLDTLEKGSLCAHGGGIPLPVRNALHYFENELNEFFN